MIPGPNVLVIVATSLSRGRRSGLQTVAGTSLAMLIQLVVAALGTGLLVNTVAAGLIWLKWAGVSYLLYLGITNLASRTDTAAQAVSPGLIFGRGFWISLTNPKTILFFAAFLPQFVTPEKGYIAQIAVLSLTFWVSAVLLDSSYALIAARLGQRFRNLTRGSLVKHCSGLVYLGAAALLAVSRRA
ncbi:MAG: LysE family translocator [Thiothrix sp.]|nr:LysE family translocator [Thiothrix sp.]